MNLNEKYGYQPYTGGAGPTTQQLNAFGELLMRVLRENNIQFTTEDMQADEVETYIVVDGRKVIHDRWGYCSYDGVLDQKDLDTTFRYLAYKQMTMKQLTAWCDQFPDDEEAHDLLNDYRADAAAEYEQFGSPEDTPRLGDPWWAHP